MTSPMIKVSVCMITYNHAPFIAQAIEGVLMQDTPFNFELIIGEDCSTDNTREICEAYQQRFPDKIKLLQSENNLGIYKNLKRTIASANGEYIAFCEGDDYWTDLLKLQKQVNFLDNNFDYGLVHSDVIYVNNRSEEISLDQWRLNWEQRTREGDLFFDYLLKQGVIMTLTVMYRKNLVRPEDFQWFVFDHWIYMEITRKSKIHFIPEKMAAYRRHDGGITKKGSDFVQSRLPYVRIDQLYRFFFLKEENMHRENSYAERKELAFSYFFLLYQFWALHLNEKSVFLKIFKCKPSLCIWLPLFIISKLKKHAHKILTN